jgi:hypothetical protein
MTTPGLTGTDCATLWALQHNHDDQPGCQGKWAHSLSLSPILHTSQLVSDLDGIQHLQNKLCQQKWQLKKWHIKTWTLTVTKLWRCDMGDYTLSSTHLGQYVKLNSKITSYSSILSMPKSQSIPCLSQLRAFYLVPFELRPAQLSLSDTTSADLNF